LNAEDIFQSFSKILVMEEDLEFAKKMVQTLSTILLTHKMTANKGFNLGGHAET
jgi:hypothetical protein